MRKLSHEEIVSRQVNQSRTIRVPIVVVLDNIRSLHNVGAIFRTADGIGIEKIFLCGITGYPPQSDIAKTALGAEESVVWEYRQDVIEVVKELKLKGFQIVVLEQAEGAVSYEDFEPQGPVALVVGNEVDGVNEGAISLCDQTIEIVMRGIKNSLNVAVAFGVVGFCFRQKLDTLRLNVISPREL
ncbi:MAG: RNA methyltransferase [Candidatus Omnitrophica bacterium]|nr:RNA methyltransferase [Candidatus Omnitrophota bacterium]